MIIFNNKEILTCSCESDVSKKTLSLNFYIQFKAYQTGLVPC